MGRFAKFAPRVATVDLRIARDAPKKADPFYLTPDWRSLMDRIIAERGRRCEDPECQYPNRTPSRVFGDHIVEIQDGGALLDPSNIMLRCGSCHTRKTAAERARRTADTVRRLEHG